MAPPSSSQFCRCQKLRPISIGWARLVVGIAARAPSLALLACTNSAGQLFLRGFSDPVHMLAIARHLDVGAHCRALHKTVQKILKGHYRYRDQNAQLHGPSAGIS